MGKYVGAVCRICRRENQKLFLKGDRCLSEKCGIVKRPTAPGQHGRRRGKVSGYNVQLREKQKVKRIYGLLEQQFHTYFLKAARSKGVTGEVLLQMLERRLDNVIYRLGFAVSRKQARQLVTHGHALVNGKKVDISSYLVMKGQVIEIRENSRKIPSIVGSLESGRRATLPKWLELDPTHFRGTILGMPTKEDVGFPVQEQLIVELYSK
jgi:small subunit ribosomal protein S4